MKEAQEKMRSANTQHRRDKEGLQSSIDDLEAQLRAEIKKRERAERESEQQQKNKDEELIQAKERLVQLEREQRRMQIQVQETEEAKQKSLILEKDVDKIKKEYDDLTTKVWRPLHTTILFAVLTFNVRLTSFIKISCLCT